MSYSLSKNQNKLAKEQSQMLTMERVIQQKVDSLEFRVSCEKYEQSVPKDAVDFIIQVSLTSRKPELSWCIGRTFLEIKALNQSLGEYLQQTIKPWFTHINKIA